MMDSTRVRTVILLFTVVLATGCATTPTQTIWRAWTRTEGPAEGITTGASVAVTVKGEAKPGLGDPSLLDADYGRTLGMLLERRGYRIVERDASYLVTLLYRTDKATRTSALFFTQSVAESYSSRPVALGVNIADAYATRWDGSATQSDVLIRDGVAYEHALAVELHAPDGRLLWKGESAWESPTPSAENYLLPALQILLSSLPGRDDVVPVVDRVADGKGLNYYRLYCEGRWFVCPALPYRIAFQELKSEDTPMLFGMTGGMPPAIHDPAALAAFTDLVQTAEYALPVGDTDYSDPLDTSLWAKAVLGGKYRLDPDSPPQPILVTLRGRKSGYEVVEARVVTDREYSDFTLQMTRWQGVLREYFNVYE